MKKTVQIVTIPLNKKGWDIGDIMKSKSCNRVWLINNTNINETLCFWQSQQLLVLSDDDIQAGEVMYSVEFGKVFKTSYKTTHDQNNWKVIASYPQIEGTLPISKETVQKWIDAGTPGEGSVEMKHKCTGRNTIGTTPAGEPIKMNSFIETPKLDPQGNLLLEFGNQIDRNYPEEYELTQDDAKEWCESIKPPIPTDEEIREKADEYAYAMKGQLYTEKGQHPANTAWSLLNRGYTDGYKQALKDLGYE
jgi:hypothetical protein